jgi:hypothetical protein
VIQTIDEFTGIDGPPSAKVQHQEQLAAAMLDELAAAGFSDKPIVEIAWKESANDARDHAELVREGETKPSLTIDMNEAGTVTVKPPGHAPITRRDPTWASKPTRAEQREMDKAANAGEIHCFNPGFLRGAMVDLSHRFALIDIGYRGNDSCWEGSDSQVLITW